MGNCCSRGPKTSMMLESALQDLMAKRSSIVWCCLVADEGKNILASWPESEEAEGMLQQINAFRKSGQLFSSTMQQYESTSMHVCAIQTMFSSYVVQRCTLNILSDIQTTEENQSEMIETDELDSLVAGFTIRVQDIFALAST